MTDRSLLAQLQDLAVAVTARLTALDAQRELFNGAYGDSRGASYGGFNYTGSMERDLRLFTDVAAALSRLGGPQIDKESEGSSAQGHAGDK